MFLINIFLYYSNIFESNVELLFSYLMWRKPNRSNIFQYWTDQSNIKDSSQRYISESFAESSYKAEGTATFSDS